MLKEITTQINERKQNKAPYFTLIAKIEENIHLLSLYEKSQAYVLLYNEYLFNDDKIKINNYFLSARETLLECFSKNILDKNDYIHFCGLLSDIFALEIKYNGNYIDVKLLKEKEEYKYIKQNSNSIFYALVELYNKYKKSEILLDIIDYISNRTHLDILFNIYFSYCQPIEVFIDKIKTINDFDGYLHYYLIFIYLNDKLLESVCNHIIGRKNNLADLNIIYSNAIKSDNILLYKTIINNICQFADEPHLNYYKILSDDTQMIQKSQFNENDFIIRKLITEYLLFKKDYKTILKYSTDMNLIFYCLVKLNKFKEAKNMIEQNDTITAKNLYKYFLLTKDYINTLNILIKINDPIIFNKCMKKAYKNKNLKILKEGISIGIDKFGSKNINLLKTFISFLHLDEINIELGCRLEMILKIVKEISFDDLFDNEVQWLYNLCYNNIIDSIMDKNINVLELINICFQIKGYTNELIYLCLVTIKNNIGADVFKLEKLYIEYLKNEKKEMKINILFYEMLNNDDIITLIKPLSKINDYNMIKLLKINSNKFTFRISLLKECERRNLLTKEIINDCLAMISIYGPNLVYEFLVAIDFKKYFNSYLENIFNKQIELLKIIKNTELILKFEELLIAAKINK